jgi:hypothetical protein
MRHFTARQIVTLIVAVCAAAVLVPTSVWATAKIAKFELTDGSGKVAQVSSGRLEVAPPAAATTTPFHNLTEEAGSEGPQLIWGGTGSAQLHIGSITIAVSADTVDNTSSEIALVTVPASSSCSASGGPAVTVALFSFPTNQMATDTYPSPWVVSAPAGKRVCLYPITSTPSGGFETIETTGYTTK